jgi:methylmalonyl-CoA/ethylmalonyl-CoA epimerase
MQKKPVFKNIVQVALVVKDCMAYIKRYNDIYGLGPWAIYEMNPDSVQNMTVHGKPVNHAMRLAVTIIGNVQLELIQPLDEKSIYAEFLREHGDGFHHLLFDVEDYKGTVKFLQGRGAEFLQGGAVQAGEYAYYDTTADLGMISEIFASTPGETALPKPDDVYPKGA